MSIEFTRRRTRVVFDVPSALESIRRRRPADQSKYTTAGRDGTTFRVALLGKTFSAELDSRCIMSPGRAAHRG